MRKLLGLVDRISWWTSHLAMVTIFVLIAAVCYEVVARYFFAAPTRLAFDASYMLTGSIFILAVGLTTQVNGHVRIDFLSSLMPGACSAPRQSTGHWRHRHALHDLDYL